MSRIVFLLEEYSMKVFLDGLLPRLYPGLPFLCVPHEGKQDLERSIPRKLRAWHEPGVRFCVIRDNDGADCKQVKANLVALCSAGRRGETLVRVACQELEAWYFGSPEALAVTFADDALRNLDRRARFRDPDAIVQPSTVLGELVPAFQKVSGARQLAQALTRENGSRSFQSLLAGLDRICQERED
jgi:hypothetical protein